jgi:two-component system OmpR family response regulator
LQEHLLRDCVDVFQLTELLLTPHASRPCHHWTARRIGGAVPVFKILVIDDDRASADALSAVLGVEGYNVRHAYGALEALDKIDGWAPDIVFLDISMPVHDGFATAKVLRRLNRTRRSVLVAHTALMEDYVRARSATDSFDAYCQKGTSVSQLLAMLRLYRQTSEHP